MRFRTSTAPNVTNVSSATNKNTAPDDQIIGANMAALNLPRETRLKTAPKGDFPVDRAFLTHELSAWREAFTVKQAQEKCRRPNPSAFTFAELATGHSNRPHNTHGKESTAGLVEQPTQPANYARSCQSLQKLDGRL